VLACHIALYSLLLQSHEFIIRFFCAIFPLLHLHHNNVYHSLLGDNKVIGKSDSLYEFGLFSLFVQLFILYIILYVFSVAIGENSLEDVKLFHICGLATLVAVYE
jgi:hypothetical protein